MNPEGVASTAGRGRTSSQKERKRINVKWVGYDPLKRVCEEHVPTINRPQPMWPIERGNWFGWGYNSPGVGAQQHVSLTQEHLWAPQRALNSSISKTRRLFYHILSMREEIKTKFQKSSLKQIFLSLTGEVKGDNTDSFVKDFPIYQPDW